MTVINADIKDRDVIAKTCAQQGIECYFLENRVGDLMTVAIYCDSPGIMWHLGRMVQIQVEMKEFSERT